MEQTLLKARTDDRSPSEVDEQSGPGDLRCSGPADDRRAGLRTTHVLSLAACVTIARYVFSWNRYAFTLSPDEVANAGMARFLAGGHWNMFNAQTWRPGVATLLTPLAAVVDDPDWFVRGSLIINAVLGGASVIWLAKLVARLARTSPRATLVISGVIALTPSAMVASAHVWAEPLVTLLFLAGLWAVLRFHDTPSFGWGLTAIALACAANLAHSRMLPFAITTTLVVVWRVLRDRRYRNAGCLLGIGVVGVVVADFYTRWMIARLWAPGERANDVGSVIGRLGNPGAVANAFVGQSWYLLCATAGLIGFGVVVLVRRALSGSDRRSDVADAQLVLLSTAPLVALSIVFMSDRPRPDHLIYGRYNDAIVWPIIGVGAAWLFFDRHHEARRTRRWMLGGTAVLTAELGLLLRQLNPRLLRAGGPAYEMIAGLGPAIVGSGTIHVMVITALSLGVMGILWLLSERFRSRPMVVVAVLAVCLVAAGLRVQSLLDPGVNYWAAGQNAREFVVDEIDPATTIGLSMMPDIVGPSEPVFTQLSVALHYEWYLPEYRFALDRGPGDAVGPYVIATTNNRVLIDGGGVIVWRDDDHDMAIWREGPDPNPSVASVDSP